MFLRKITGKKLAVSLLDFINRLIAPIDRPFLQKPDEIIGQPLFIIGAPRSGTTLTYQLITQYFDVAYFNNSYNYLYGVPNILGYFTRPFTHNPSPIFESSYGHIKGIFSPGEPANFWFQWFPRDGGDGHYLPPEKTGDRSLDHMREIIFSLISLHGRPMVFKNVYLSINAGTIADIFPKARFIFIKRDMLSTIQSTMLAREKKASGGWWSVKPPGYKVLLDKPLWEQVTTQIYLVNWYTSRSLRACAGERIMEIDYEAICSSPIRYMNTVEEWLYEAGYRKRDKICIPDSFTANTALHLPQKLITQIKSKLVELQETHRD